MHIKTSKTSHHTIGLLIEDITGPYQSGIWPGIACAAGKLGVQVQCYCGGALDFSPQNPWEYQRNSIYDFAVKSDLDGYIISGSLGGYVSHHKFIEFVKRFEGRPVVSLIPVLDSIPAVYVDNHKGMYDLVTHLICDHNYKTFAFIRGPEGNSEAEERFMLFKELLDNHKLTLNPDTVIQGDFTRESGVKAVEYLFDRNLNVDAIIASADEIAIGCLNALRERGIDVPGKIAVVGFDDIFETSVVSPPLTTVRQPMSELGKIAVEMLVELIKGEKVPSTAVLDTTLKIRQSCGCFEYSLPAAKTTLSRNLESKHDVSAGNGSGIQSILSRIDPSIHKRAGKLIEAFINDVDSMQNVMFIKEVDKVAGEYLFDAGFYDSWNAVFMELWFFAQRSYEFKKLTFANTLLFESAGIRVEAAKRMQGFKIVSEARENRIIRKLGQTIANILDMDLLFDTAVKHFPKLGIKTFFIMLYDNVEKNSGLQYKLICINGKRRLSLLSKNNKAGLMSGLSGVFDPAYPPVFIIEPLYFQKECFGMLVCENDVAVNAERYEIVSEYLSGALHSAFLMQKVQHQSAILEKANKELARLQVKEHAYLESVNRELEQGRKIQKGFLPEYLPQPKGWEVAASFVPARAVSGDFYDAFMLDDKYMALVIADVSGKDVSAALFMALICTLIRILTERLHAEGLDPLESAKIINEYVFSHYSQAKDRQMYTTLFLGLLDVNSSELRYCNAGHYAPLLLSNAGIDLKLPPTGPALGLIPEAEFIKKSVILPPESILFAYTDGVTDARSPEGIQFTSNRLFNILQQPAGSATEKLSQVETALFAHINGAEPSDDITILVLRRAGNGI
ncbi:MAG TPA: hypothetical protein DCO75_05685 [Fibrobacteres bacterium]|nr:hypothetical protein [Fibrobacterota bacterium]